MSRSAGKSWRARAGAVAMLLPMLALAACGSNERVMAEKLAAAEAAAQRAEAAQHAAERAAAAAAHPAPTASASAAADALEPDSDDSDDNSSAHEDGNELSMGGPGQSVAADGTVIPGA